MFFYIKFKFGTIKIYSMYKFVTLHFCASIAHLGTRKGKKPIMDYPKMSPIEFIAHMYSRSITTKAFKERNYILAPGTELNIH